MGFPLAGLAPDVQLSMAPGDGGTFIGLPSIRPGWGFSVCSPFVSFYSNFHFAFPAIDLFHSAYRTKPSFSLYRPGGWPTSLPFAIHSRDSRAEQRAGNARVLSFFPGCLVFISRVDIETTVARSSPLKPVTVRKSSSSDRTTKHDITHHEQHDGRCGRVCAAERQRLSADGEAAGSP